MPNKTLLFTAISAVIWVASFCAGAEDAGELHPKGGGLFTADSARQQYNMTRRWSWNIPSWALYHGTDVEKKGYFPVESFTIALNQ